MKNKFSLGVLFVLGLFFIASLIFSGVIKYILIDTFQISWILIVYILSLSAIFFTFFVILLSLIDVYNVEKNLFFVTRISFVLAVLIGFSLIDNFYNKDLLDLNKCKEVILNERYTLTLEEVEKLDKNKDRLCFNKNVVPRFLEYYILRDKQKLDNKLEKERVEKEMKENIEEMKENKKEEIIKKYME